VAPSSGTSGLVISCEPPFRCRFSRPWSGSQATGAGFYRSVYHPARPPLEPGGDPMPIKLTVNGKAATVDAPGEMPLLWVLRDVLDLKGTKYGCGMSMCGMCTVHVDGEATRSCVTPVASVEGKRITTIEGLSADASHPVQRAWMEIDVPQCGYCQAGQIMSAAALLA